MQGYIVRNNHVMEVERVEICWERKLLIFHRHCHDFLRLFGVESKSSAFCVLSILQVEWKWKSKK